MPSDKVTRTRKKHCPIEICKRTEWYTIQLFKLVQQDSSEFLNSYLMVIVLISKAQIVTFSVLVKRESDLVI